MYVFMALPVCFSFISSTGFVIVKTGSQIPHLSTMLPEGNVTNDYNVTIKVEISDQGGATYEDIIKVKVKLFKYIICSSSLQRYCKKQ